MALPEAPPASALDASNPDEGGRDKKPVPGAEAGLPPLPPPLAEDPEHDEEDKELDQADASTDGNGNGDGEVQAGANRGFGFDEDDAADASTNGDDEMKASADSGFGFDEKVAADSRTNANSQGGNDDDLSTYGDGDGKVHAGSNGDFAFDEDVAADASTDGSDEMKAGAEGGFGFGEEDAADSAADVDIQEADDGDDDAASTDGDEDADTDPVIRAVAVAVVLGLVGALLLGVATTTTAPRHQGCEYNFDTRQPPGYEYNVDTRQPPLLCGCGDHLSRACHPWGTTSTAAPRPPLVVPDTERLPLPQITRAPSPTAPITGTDDHPRVVSGAAEWAAQHQRGGTSSAVPTVPTAAAGSTRRFVLYFCVFFVVSMLVAAFQKTMLH